MPALTSHFTSAELGVDGAPAEVQAAAYNTAVLLEDVRAALGVPLKVTSGYRSPAHNEAVGGVANSQHLSGNAADVLPQGQFLGDSYDRLRAALEAGKVRTFGQIILYPFPLPGGKAWGHIHVSTVDGTNSVNRVILVVPDGESFDYVYPAEPWLGEMPRAGAAVLAVLPFVALVALVLLLLLLSR